MKSTLYIQMLLKYPIFVHSLRQCSPCITRQELIVAVFVREGLYSSEIAERLHCSLRTVENHRFRIRRKLGLDTSKNLADFLLELKGDDVESMQSIQSVV
ncbi:MAG: LuxR family transcriptional regulator [Candidatus Kapaibacterium sp.]|nr:MAG: LuxR family transcriptional regulator [Candidatus Kapabacteria bacterium]